MPSITVQRGSGGNHVGFVVVTEDPENVGHWFETPKARAVDEALANVSTDSQKRVDLRLVGLRLEDCLYWPSKGLPGVAIPGASASGVLRRTVASVQPSTGANSSRPASPALPDEWRLEGRLNSNVSGALKYTVSFESSLGLLRIETVVFRNIPSAAACDHILGRLLGPCIAIAPQDLDSLRARRSHATFTAVSVDGVPKTPKEAAELPLRDAVKAAMADGLFAALGACITHRWAAGFIPLSRTVPVEKRTKKIVAACEVLVEDLARLSMAEAAAASAPGIGSMMVNDRTGRAERLEATGNFEAAGKLYGENIQEIINDPTIDASLPLQWAYLAVSCIRGGKIRLAADACESGLKALAKGISIGAPDTPEWRETLRCHLLETLFNAARADTMSAGVAAMADGAARSLFMPSINKLRAEGDLSFEFSFLKHPQQPGWLLMIVAKPSGKKAYLRKETTADPRRPIVMSIEREARVAVGPGSNSCRNRTAAHHYPAGDWVAARHSADRSLKEIAIIKEPDARKSICAPLPLLRLPTLPPPQDFPGAPPLPDAAVPWAGREPTAGELAAEDADDQRFAGGLRSSAGPPLDAEARRKQHVAAAAEELKAMQAGGGGGGGGGAARVGDAVCSNCGKAPPPAAVGGAAGRKFARCGACRGACYCGTACQKAHWPQHKAACKAAAAAAAATAVDAAVSSTAAAAANELSLAK